MNEKLSAWMDSELGEQDARQFPSRIKQDADLRADWDCYHLIGDALRGVHGPDLCEKVCSRLDEEPTVLAPQRRSVAHKVRNHGLSIAASLAAVGFVGWMGLVGLQQEPAQVVAKTDLKTAPVPAGEGAKDYLLAHQRYSPSNAMQGVAPYVRTVAEERTVARR